MTNCIADVPEPSDLSKWKIAFLALGIRRGWPLLPEAGISGRITSAPESLLTTAQRFLAVQHSLGYLIPSAHSEYRRVAKRLLMITFNELSDAYGEGESRGLYLWAERFFLSAEQGSIWREWSWVLPELADVYGRGAPLVPSPLSESMHSRFVETVAKHSGPHLNDRLHVLEEESEGIELSRLEEGFLAVEPVDDDDDPYLRWDMITLLPIRRWHAYAAITELKNWMSAGEQRLVVQWARAEAKASGMPFEHLRIAG